MLSQQLFWGLILITVSVVFHVIALLVLAKILGKIEPFLLKVALNIQFVKNLLLITLSALYVITVHALEMLFWAMTFIKFGEFNELADAMYFSIITATTLGYGDIVLSEKTRLLSGFEAIGGLILFSISTAFFLRLISILFEPDENKKYN